MGKNIVLVYTCTALIIREIHVPMHEEFNVIIFCVHVTQIQDGRHLNRNESFALQTGLQTKNSICLAYDDTDEHLLTDPSWHHLATYAAFPSHAM